MKNIDIIFIITQIVGFASLAATSTVGDAIDAAIPGGHGKQIVAVLSLVSLVGGLILRVVNNKTGAPATAVTSDAVVVPPQTSVVTSQAQASSPPLQPKGP